MTASDFVTLSGEMGEEEVRITAGRIITFRMKSLCKVLTLKRVVSIIFWTSSVIIVLNLTILLWPGVLLFKYDDRLRVH